MGIELVVIGACPLLFANDDTSFWRFVVRAHRRAPAFIPLIAVLIVMAIVILAVSWKDSKRAMGEFLAPLKQLRFQFSLRTLFLITTVFAVLLKLAVWLDFWPKWEWLETVGLLAFVGIVVGMVGFVVCSYLSTFERLPKIDQSGQVPANDDDLDKLVGKKTKKKHVRFEQKKRPTTRFKW